MPITYKSLGIYPVINASATLTKLGGSLMPPEVLQAMHDAAQCFVDLYELQRKAGDHIARLTHNEAAYISSGAAAGLVLAAAACIAGDKPENIRKLPDVSGLKHEFIMHKAHRNGYDYAIEQIGGRIIEIGTSEKTSPEDFEAAITSNTAAFFWFQGAMTSATDLPLEQVIEIADSHDIPVIVDAAAQLPPVSNLWKFTEMGAALAIFSGGKDLRGPQSSGLILGQRDLIEICRMHGNPNHGVGRPMKVGKEEMMGLVAAIERYLQLDHDARAQHIEDITQEWCKSLNNIKGITAQRDFPNEAGQPLPRCIFTVDENITGITRDDIIDALENGSPAIHVQAKEDNGIWLNAMTLESGEEKIVQSKLLDILQST